MRTIIWFLYFWLYLILVLPEYWRVCRMGKQGKTEQHNRLVRTHVNNWAGRLLRLAGADITCSSPVIEAMLRHLYSDTSPKSLRRFKRLCTLL